VKALETAMKRVEDVRTPDSTPGALSKSSPGEAKKEALSPEPPLSPLMALLELRLEKEFEKEKVTRNCDLLREDVRQLRERLQALSPQAATKKAEDLAAGLQAAEEVAAAEEEVAASRAAEQAEAAVAKRAAEDAAALRAAEEKASAAKKAEQQQAAAVKKAEEDAAAAAKTAEEAAAAARKAEEEAAAAKKSQEEAAAAKAAAAKAVDEKTAAVERAGEIFAAAKVAEEEAAAAKQVARDAAAAASRKASKENAVKALETAMKRVQDVRTPESTQGALSASPPSEAKKEALSPVPPLSPLMALLELQLQKEFEEEKVTRNFAGDKENQAPLDPNIMVKPSGVSAKGPGTPSPVRRVNGRWTPSPKLGTPSPLRVGLPRWEPPEDEEEWKKRLSHAEFHILRLGKTESIGSHPYIHFFPKEGYFACTGCGLPLYSCGAKFEDSRWPTYEKCFYSKAIGCHIWAEGKPGDNYVQLSCTRCESHLGHVYYGENLTSTNERH